MSERIKIPRLLRYGTALALAGVCLSSCGDNDPAAGQIQAPVIIPKEEAAKHNLGHRAPNAVNVVKIPRKVFETPFPNYSGSMLNPPDMCGESDKDGHRGQPISEDPLIVYAVGDDCRSDGISPGSTIGAYDQPYGEFSKSVIDEDESVAVLCHIPSIDPYDRKNKVIKNTRKWLGVYALTTDVQSGVITQAYNYVFVEERNVGYVDEQALDIPRCKITSS